MLSKIFSLLLFVLSLSILGYVVFSPLIYPTLMRELVYNATFIKISDNCDKTSAYVISGLIIGFAFFTALLFTSSLASILFLLLGKDTWLRKVRRTQIIVVFSITFISVYLYKTLPSETMQASHVLNAQLFTLTGVLDDLSEMLKERDPKMRVLYEKDPDLNAAFVALRHPDAYTMIGETLLTFSTLTCNPEFAQRVLKAGADVNKPSCSISTGITPPLMSAITAPCPGVETSQRLIALLLKAGADVDQKTLDEEGAEISALSLSLEQAALSKNQGKQGYAQLVIFSALANKSKDLNATFAPTQKTLLHQAIDYRDYRLVYILLKAAANPSVKDSSGKTLLQYVNLPANQQIMGKLMQANISPTRQDTAMIINLLQKAGAE